MQRDGRLIAGGNGEWRDGDQLEQHRLPSAERQLGKMELVGKRPLNKCAPGL